jgi:hypothetical protein
MLLMASAFTMTMFPCFGKVGHAAGKGGGTSFFDDFVLTTLAQVCRLRFRIPVAQLQAKQDASRGVYGSLDSPWTAFR